MGPREQSRDTLIANGLDPDQLLGDSSNRVSIGSTEEIHHMLTTCAPSVLRQSLETMMLPIVMSLALHLFCRLQPAKSSMGHGFSFITGFLILTLFHSFMTASAMLLVMLMLINLAMFVNTSALVILVPSLLLILELNMADEWTPMRGSSLIVACKALTLFLSPSHVAMLERDDTESVIAILGYLFHPGTVVFGPWVSFEAYHASIEAPVFSISAIVAPLAPAALCLVTSTCFFSLFPVVQGYTIYRAIVETYSFHASHYYILFASQSINAMSGVANSGWYTSMIDIAVPYELNEVCRHWNRPINQFLKEHVFCNLRRRFRHRALPIIATFLFSALLHGLSFPIFITLVTLALGAYGEFEIRRKWSRYFGLDEIAPTGLYQPTKTSVSPPSTPPVPDVVDEPAKPIISRVVNWMALPWLLLARTTLKIITTLGSKPIAAFMINTTFLAINLTHLFYLGVLFSEPDMSWRLCLGHMASFDFISTKLALLEFILGYFC